MEFIKKQFTTIVFILLILGGVKSCGDSARMNKILKETDGIRSELKAIKDSTYTKEELSIQLQITGLESEKRMIQATDRKLWDLNRQTEIDKEIKKLKGEK